MRAAVLILAVVVLAVQLHLARYLVMGLLRAVNTHLLAAEGHPSAALQVLPLLAEPEVVLLMPKPTAPAALGAATHLVVAGLPVVLVVVAG